MCLVNLASVNIVCLQQQFWIVKKLHLTFARRFLFTYIILAFSLLFGFVRKAAQHAILLEWMLNVDQGKCLFWMLNIFDT